MSGPNNHVSIIGNVGAEPVERAKTRDGKSVVGFAVAQSVSVPDGATGKLFHKGAQWFQVACFAGLADRVCAHLKKGDLVLVVGELKATSYTSKNGERRTGVEVSASDVLRVTRLRRLDASAPAESSGADIPTFDDWGETSLNLSAPNEVRNGE